MWKYDEFVARWTTRKEEWERLQIGAPAAVVAEILTELDALMRDEANTLVNLDQAAKISGQSKETIARKVRNGCIPNAGRKGSPRVRIGDLTRVAHTDAGSYNPCIDARKLRSRR